MSREQTLELEQLMHAKKVAEMNKAIRDTAPDPTEMFTASQIEEVRNLKHQIEISKAQLELKRIQCEILEFEYDEEE